MTAAAVLAATAAGGGAGILCTILLIATVIAVIIGLAEVLGLYSTGVGGRFGALVVAVILLVVYFIVC